MQPRRGFRWRAVQLAPQRAGTEIVPMQRLATLPEVVIAPHQSSIGIFATRILLDDAVTPEDTTGQVAPLKTPVREPGDQEEVLVFQFFSATDGPVRVHVLDQVVVAIQRLRAFVLPDGVLRSPLAFETHASRDVGAECLDVDPDSGGGIQRQASVAQNNVIAFLFRPGLERAKGMAQRVERDT